MEEQIKCPKCGSTQIVAGKKGFNPLKAAGGALLTGGIGLLAGFHKSGKVTLGCMKCGNTWDPKKQHQQEKNAENKTKIVQNENWKNSFYAAYNNQNMSKAEDIYREKYAFGQAGVNDVHDAYKHLKSIDNQNTGCMIAAMVVIVIAAIWIMSKIF